jgi:hypothetical protein
MRRLLRSLLSIAMIVLAVTAVSFAAIAEDSPSGTYVGRFTNSDGASHRMLTEFTGTGSSLSGKYLAGNSDVILGDDAGSMALVERNGQDFTFRWTDRWGSGLAYLTFVTDFTSFSGNWTYKGRPEGDWTGTRP